MKEWSLLVLIFDGFVDNEKSGKSNIFFFFMREKYVFFFHIFRNTFREKKHVQSLKNFMSACNSRNLCKFALCFPGRIRNALTVEFNGLRKII